MTTRLISPEAIALVLEGEEIENSPEAKEIVLTLLKNEGYPTWDDMEIEIFEMSDHTLLIARKTTNYRTAYGFTNFELLLQSITENFDNLPSKLINYNGVYYLLTTARDNSMSNRQNEFSDTIRPTDNQLEHIKEHGKVIIPENAVEKLKKNFA